MPEIGPRTAHAIGIVLLAAGRGTRFGEAPKLLADLGGRPLVRHAAEAARASGLAPVIAVLGAHAPAVRSALAGLDLRFVENPHYADGLSTSLRAGLAALPEACTGALVMLGDMPRVGPDLLRRLAGSFDRTAAAIVPVWQGRRGNPVLLNRCRLATELAGLSGDRGAGPLLAGRTDVVEIAGDPGTGLDIDTPEALAGLRGGSG